MARIFILASAIIILASQGECWKETPYSRMGFRYHKHSHHEKKHHSENDVHISPNQILKEQSVCHTKECFRIAGELWENMNPSVDPCVDFYEYACGKFPEKNPVPPTEKSWEPLSMVQEVVSNRIRDLLEEETHKDEIVPAKIARKYYKSCMNLEAIEEAGLRPIETMLVATGGWPLIMEENEWNAEEFKWQQVEDYYSRLTQQFALFNFDVTVNWFKEVIILAVSQPTLPLDADYNRSVLYEHGKYQGYIKKVALELAKMRDSRVSEEAMQKDIDDIIEFEKRLMEYEDEDDEIDDSEITTEQVQELFSDESSQNIPYLQAAYDKKILHRDNDVPSINWVKKIKGVFDEMGLDFDESANVTIWTMQYFLHLAEVLSDTPARTVVNFVQWNYISQLLDYTTEEMRTLKYEVTNEDLGIKEEQPRWKECVSELKLEDAISYLFVKKYFTEKMKTDAQEMLTGLKKAMEKKILKADWLDEDTRNDMLQKVHKIKANIGHPDWYNNMTAINSVHTGLVIGRQWFDNALSMHKYLKKKEFKSIGENMEDAVGDGWVIDPTLVNAVYIPQGNVITVPAADFYTPIYDEHRTDVLNWGAIGMIIGHEISHGFDPEGHRFNKDGKPEDWKNKTEAIYATKGECFVKQYDNYYQNEAARKNKTYEENGEGTLSENVADSLGEDTIFDAFKNHESKKSVSRLPGFEQLTSDQLFFLSFANLWCTATTPEYEELTNGDSHSKAKYRVIAPVQNSESFAKAFKCPSGSPMNPEVKCKIW